MPKRACLICGQSFEGGPEMNFRGAVCPACYSDLRHKAEYDTQAASSPGEQLPDRNEANEAQDCPDKQLQ